MLKAEATDLKMLPLYYNFQDKVAIRKIYAKSRQCVIPSKIEDALSDPIHLEIDKIVFGSLNLSNVSAIIRDKLLEKIKMRSAKSKTAKKK